MISMLNCLSFFSFFHVVGLRLPLVLKLGMAVADLFPSGMPTMAVDTDVG